MNSSYKIYTLTNGGGTITLDDKYPFYLIRGTATLAASWSITAAVPTVPTSYKIVYAANATYTGANVVDSFGTPLTTDQAANVCLIDVSYDFVGARWVVAVCEGFSNDNSGMSVIDMNLAGDTISLTSNSKQWQYLRGNGVLAGNYTVNTSGTFRNGQTLFVKYAATLTPGVSTVNLLDNSLSVDMIEGGNVLVIGGYDLANTTFRTQLIITPPTPYTYASIVYVSLDGSNTTGKPKRPDRPFLTVAAAMTSAATLTPSSSNRVLIKLMPGNYSSASTVQVPDWVDMDMGNASIICSNSGNPTLELLGRSNIWGEGASLVNSGNGTALYSSAFAGGSVDISLLRGVINMTLGGATMFLHITTITPTGTATTTGFTNIALSGGAVTFISENCFSGINCTTGSQVDIRDSVIKNGVLIDQDAVARVFNSQISRDNVNTVAAVVQVSNTGYFASYGNRIESLVPASSGVLNDFATTTLIFKATTIVAGAGKFSIQNTAVGAINVYDYSGNTYNLATGGTGGAITELVDTPIIDVNVT